MLPLPVERTMELALCLGSMLTLFHARNFVSKLGPNGKA